MEEGLLALLGLITVSLLLSTHQAHEDRAERSHVFCLTYLFGEFFVFCPSIFCSIFCHYCSAAFLDDLLFLLLLLYGPVPTLQPGFGGNHAFLLAFFVH